MVLQVRKSVGFLLEFWSSHMALTTFGFKAKTLEKRSFILCHPPVSKCELLESVCFCSLYRAFRSLFLIFCPEFIVVIYVKLELSWPHQKCNSLIIVLNF